MSGTNVEALYADWDGSIYLRGRSITTLARVQLVGLLTESLDDQRFTLASIYGTDAEQDERSAYDALVAGDVRWAMRAYAATLPLGERCQAQAATRLPLDAGCPATVRPPAPIGDPISAEISFPEQYGLRFVSQLRAAGGVAAVDGAFRHPPRSSADILSVPHYRLDRSVTPLPFPPHRGKLVDFGTLGGYTLSLVLANGDPQRVARGDEVQGWRGDSFSTYVAGGRSCVTDWVIFDQPAQRDRFLSQAHAAGVTATPRSSANEATLTICSRG